MPNFRLGSLAAIVAVALFAVCVFTPSLSRADTVALVELQANRAEPIQRQIRAVLEKHDYDVALVAERGDHPESTATIEATFSKTKKRWTLVVEVWSGASGSLLHTTTFRGRKPAAIARMVKRTLWKRIRKALSKAEPDAQEEPVEDEIEDEVADDDLPDTAVTSEKKTKPTKVKQLSQRTWPYSATVSGGMRLYSRRFGYEGDLPTPLALFYAPTVVALEIEGVVFPVQNYGVIARYSYSPEFTSAVNDSEENTFVTTARSFMVGAIAQHPLGRMTPTVELDYGGQNFTVKGTLPLPNVRYRYLRIGAGVDYRVHSRVGVGVHAGYRTLLSAGELESEAYFPKLSGSAVDGALSVDVALLPKLNLGIRGSLTRYSSSLNTEAGDLLIAGTATDRYSSVQLLLNYQL